MYALDIIGKCFIGISLHSGAICLTFYTCTGAQVVINQCKKVKAALFAKNI